MMESVRNMDSLEHFLLSSSILQQQCQGHRLIGENGETCSLRCHHSAIPYFVGMIVLTSQGIMQAPAIIAPFEQSQLLTTRLQINAPFSHRS